MKIREILYVPDPTRSENVIIGAIFESTIGEYFARRIANWAPVLAIDPEADLEFLDAALQDCLADPKRFLLLTEQASLSIRLAGERMLPVEDLPKYLELTMGSREDDGASAS